LRRMRGESEDCEERSREDKGRGGGVAAIDDK